MFVIESTLYEALQLQTLKNNKIMRIKSYSKSELANLYGISGATFKKWLTQLTELNIPANARILTPKQVAYIFEEFGVPQEINKPD